MKSVLYSLADKSKGILANDCSAGEGSGFYSAAAGYSACVDVMVVLNYEGTNTDDSPIAARSTFHY